MLLFMIFLFILSIQISQSFHIKRFIILALFNLTRAPILFQLVDVGYIKSDTEGYEPGLDSEQSLCSVLKSVKSAAHHWLVLASTLPAGEV